MQVGLAFGLGGCGVRWPMPSLQHGARSGPATGPCFYVFWRISLNFIIFHFKISVLYKIGKLANSPVKDELRKLGCAVKFGN
jgi:hypothetical protein